MGAAHLLVLGSALLTAGASSAAAHSLQDLEQQLWQRETYFQRLDRQTPDFTLQDAAGRKVSLDDLRGKVVVLHFIYANCPDVCPLHAERIAEIQAMVDRTPMRELVQFVSITTDPARDTPELLRDYGPLHGLDPANWLFLTSGPEQPEDATRKLAQRFGHTFTQGADGYQLHSVVTHVIDRDGRWRANFHGLKFEPTNLVVYVNALTNAHGREGHAEPNWWDKIRNLL